jgi:putative colanic acid biosynthesis acetyltransferase WcaF
MDKKIFPQKSPYESPWSISQRIKMQIWEYTWILLCSWTPKPANLWRLFILKIFGAKLYGRPFVHQRARIQIPWNLTMYHKSCIGDRANVYTLGKIEILEHAVIAQEAYICTGTHAFDKTAMNLITIPITIGKHAFVGARAFIMPGITVGDYAVIGANSLVSMDVEPWTVVGGNPAKFIKNREIKNEIIIIN